MTIKLFIEQHLEFLSFKEGCTCSSESTLSLVKMPYCWKSCVAAHMFWDLTEDIESTFWSELSSTSIHCDIGAATVKPVLRGHSKRPKIGFQDPLSLNAGQKYCRVLQREYSAILSTFIKLSLVIKIFILSILEWPLKTGFTVRLW